MVFRGLEVAMGLTTSPELLLFEGVAVVCGQHGDRWGLAFSKGGGSFEGLWWPYNVSSLRLGD